MMGSLISASIPKAVLHPLAVFLPTVGNTILRRSSNRSWLLFPAAPIWGRCRRNFVAGRSQQALLSENRCRWCWSAQRDSCSVLVRKMCEKQYQMWVFTPRRSIGKAISNGGESLIGLIFPGSTYTSRMSVLTLVNDYWRRTLAHQSGRKKIE